MRSLRIDDESEHAARDLRDRPGPGLLAAALAHRGDLRVGIAAQTREQAVEIARRLRTLTDRAALMWKVKPPKPDSRQTPAVSGQKVRWPGAWRQARRNACRHTSKAACDSATTSLAGVRTYAAEAGLVSGRPGVQRTSSDSFRPHRLRPHRLDLTVLHLAEHRSMCTGCWSGRCVLHLVVGAADWDGRYPCPPQRPRLSICLRDGWWGLSHRVR